ncbi:MAG: CusA/CzcA family heavy metal efflux RND transporter [Candidatus Omnitrophica bacterium CG11_big_fil_rev_8_21_14_0_20_42_13]|uniref:CusA/CzcA family heavy metal efflux RND transporter n=1 Tax=Candidatus Ghiorseimicrobium undicola TaxID=1974746 RepID=A0A2H0LZ27_9BACT|nr:MAG: CusA/CzcA family heavy metal efflux RND transporter [Candidatus Omnitrophica bacterium CG11_big_fil_rev_8_21_14_0_20_42_13]
MIKSIIETCLKNRFLVIAVFALIIFWGWHSMRNTPIDAIPDIGELQILVYADWPGRSPKDVEDQVIYPLTTGLMGVPKVKVVRSTSAFGFGLVNMIFQEGTDFYWARTRVLERLDFAKKGLPNNAIVILGPDATALGQIFWYTVENGYYCPNHPQERFAKTGKCPQDGEDLIASAYDLSELRSIQDWYVRYQLNAVEGVSEVASVGGYVKQYQIDVDPNKLLVYDIKLHQLIAAVEKSNIDVGAKVFEEGGAEFVVRGVGFIKTVSDIENIVVNVQGDVPVYVKNLSTVSLGPEFRRNALDREGVEATGGVVLMRYGENPLKVIERIKKRIEELSVGLPHGVRIVSFYDRTGLIMRAIGTLKNALIQEIIITIFVIVIFLLHFAGSLIISCVLPIGVLIAFILMYQFGIDANIMSLGGIAIAVGVMVDSGCVLVENIYRKLVEARKEKNTDKLSNSDRLDVCIEGAAEVGRPVLFAVLTTIIGFLPVFVLTGQAGRLFRPLAFTKTFAMFGAAVIALTLLPVLCYYLLRGRLTPVEENKTARLLHSKYKPMLLWSLQNKKVIFLISAAIVIVGLFLGAIMKQEFMPPLNEGDLLFMPVLLPGASLTQVMDVMKKQDIIIKNEIPEVEWVVGKLGRAETATDPAPVIMIETIIHLKDKKFWRRSMSRDKLIREIQDKTMMPGVSPIMTQPIRNRIDMLATGIQTPVGVKVFGDDLEKIVDIGVSVERIVRDVEGAVSPFAERTSERPYFEIEIDREQAARYGVKIGEIQHIIMTAIGGMNLTTTVEGRERYPVRIRYLRELRDSPQALERIFVPTPGGEHIPLAQLASLKKVPGPAVINSENTITYARVFVNVNQEKVGLIDFVNNAKAAVNAKIKSGELKLPSGYFISWSGQFESEMESRRRLIPSLIIALSIILILLYMAFKDFSSLFIISTGIPVSLMGGIILLFILGFRFSTAVWVGFIAIFGVATDDAILVISKINDLFKKQDPKTIEQIRSTIIEACLLKVRPAMMTTMTTIIALMPVMLSSGTGSEIMKPMASPTVGGLITATLSNLILVPVLYCWIKERQLKKALV